MYNVFLGSQYKWYTTFLFLWFTSPVWQSLDPSMLLQMPLFHFFNDWVLFHCVYVPYLFYPFLYLWTFRLLPCLDYCKQYCDEHWGTCILLNHFFFLDIFPEVGLQDHIVTLYFSIVAVPIYIPTNRVGEFLSLHVLSSICCLWIFLMIAILTGIKWYLITVLIAFL